MPNLDSLKYCNEYDFMPTSITITVILFQHCRLFSFLMRNNNFYHFLFFALQVDDTEVISFLLSTEIIPLCLRTMEMGSELSKTVECLVNISSDSSPFFLVIFSRNIPMITRSLLSCNLDMDGFR